MTCGSFSKKMEETSLASDQAMQSWRSVQEARHHGVRDELKRLEESVDSRHQESQKEVGQLVQRIADNRLELEDRLTRNIDSVRQRLVEESQEHVSRFERIREELKKESYRGQDQLGIIETLSAKIEQVSAQQKHFADELSNSVAPVVESVELLQKHVSAVEEQIGFDATSTAQWADQVQELIHARGNVEGQLEDLYSRVQRANDDASRVQVQQDQLSAQVAKCEAKCEANIATSTDVIDLRNQLGLERAQRERLERVIDEQIECEHEMRNREAEKLQEVIDVQRSLLSQGDGAGDVSKVCREEVIKCEEEVIRFKDEVNERITSLEEFLGNTDQRAGNYEVLLRNESEQRKKENRRIWEAIDTHTHEVCTQNMMAIREAASREAGRGGDVGGRQAIRDSNGRGGADRDNAGSKVGSRKTGGRSPQVRPVIERLANSKTTGYPQEQAEEKISAEDAYLPFPCQPLTSFLRISGQRAGLSDSDNEIFRR